MNIEIIQRDLGANYRDDEEELAEIFEQVYSLASSFSNQSRIKENRAFDLIVSKAIKAIYLSRGAEGISSKTEGSITTSFNNAINEMKNDIITLGLRKVY